MCFYGKSSILPPSSAAVIGENIQSVRDRISRACGRAGRDPAGVTLVAVSKTFDAARVAEAHAAGLSDFGENYPQELRAKREALRGSEGIRWHFTGHLQRNKVRFLAEWIHLVHSVDSERLAASLSEAGARAGRSIPVLIEVNTTGEDSKFGCRPEEALELSRRILAMSALRLDGLMTIGPLPEDPEDARPAFRLLREVRDRIREDGAPAPHLSMGMTGDFEVALEEGATILRIGTAIFGSRVPRTAKG